MENQLRPGEHQEFTTLPQSWRPSSLTADNDTLPPANGAYTDNLFTAESMFNFDMQDLQDLQWLDSVQ